MKIHKGDNVQMVLGKDNGKTGKVERVLIKTSKIMVSGMNVYKRHVSPKRMGMEGGGGILDIQKPVDISNVMLVCPNCKKPTRVGFNINKDVKLRICKKCGKDIDGKQSLATSSLSKA